MGVKVPLDDDGFFYSYSVFVCRIYFTGKMTGLGVGAPAIPETWLLTTVWKTRLTPSRYSLCNCVGYRLKLT